METERISYGQNLQKIDGEKDRKKEKKKGKDYCSICLIILRCSEKNADFRSVEGRDSSRLPTPWTLLSPSVWDARRGEGSKCLLLNSF